MAGAIHSRRQDHGRDVQDPDDRQKKEEQDLSRKYANQVGISYGSVLPRARQYVMKNEVKTLLEAGPFNSPWASLIVLVPKPDGTLCLCVD